MEKLIFRTVILYILIVLLMRLSGKREVGQLGLSELVTAFMVSELASTPIADTSVPLSDGVVPTITLIILEVVLSFAGTKSKTVRKIFAGYPEVLIDKGKLSKKALSKARLTTEELLSSLRGLGYSSLDDVYYAFLEPSGNITALPKASTRPPTVSELKMSVPEAGVQHVVVSDGKINKAALRSLKMSERELDKLLDKHRIKDVKEIFFLGIDDSGNVFVTEQNS